MAFTGHAAPVLWVLLAADLVVSAGIAYLAWKGLASAAEPSTLSDPGALPPHALAKVVRELAPEGVVNLGGEHWSAICLNGTVAVGEKVRVVGRKGVRLEVWRDEETPASELFELGEPAPPELFTVRRPAEPAETRSQAATSPPDTSSAHVAGAGNESEEPRQWKSE